MHYDYSADGNELYLKHRPTMWKQVVGQPGAVATLEKLVKAKRVPHALLFCGSDSSGCGKTTLARITAIKMGCPPPMKPNELSDYMEQNCADARGIDMIRDIRSRMSLNSLVSPCRVWVLDEVHKLTGDAQSSLLKILEDTPRHVYFMLCTTESNKLLKTIVTRCTEIKCKPLTPRDVKQVVTNVLEAEKQEVSEEVMDRIAEVADGSARKALVLLHQVLQIEDEDGCLEAIQAADVKRQSVEVAQALLNPRCQWAEIAKVLKTVDEDAESIRHLVLGYMSKVVLGGGKLAGRAATIIYYFRNNFFDSKKAGLIMACWEVIHPK